MERFTWRPALLARHWRVDVSAEGLAMGGAPLRPWADLDEVGWAFDEVAQTLVIGLRLRWGRREVVLGYRGRGPMPSDYAAMLRAVVRALAAARPDLEVVIGHGGRPRRAMFVTGVGLAVLGLAGVALGLWWLVTLSVGEALGPGIVGAVVAPMGLAIALANRPWVALPRMPLADFAAGFDPGPK
ncbi:hypothetical protein [Roseicyclus mahoneyensis]|uniref:Uncharacterized protein n=1 Tax=Roseicyclus mahoneyensis TaxID=164332 RepID=A0A316GNZ3_9RHOB|nr:hypothetical protein [Roseicyclus mahoneyensis]PWK62880.1 hypothetical protein C7455_101919 [Roseicyclus mahoneyensis]